MQSSCNHFPHFPHFHRKRHLQNPCFPALFIQNSKPFQNDFLPIFRNHETQSSKPPSTHFPFIVHFPSTFLSFSLQVCPSNHPNAGISTIFSAFSQHFPSSNQPSNLPFCQKAVLAANWFTTTIIQLGRCMYHYLAMVLFCSTPSKCHELPQNPQQLTIFPQFCWSSPKHESLFPSLGRWPRIAAGANGLTGATAAAARANGRATASYSSCQHWGEPSAIRRMPWKSPNATVSAPRFRESWASQPAVVRVRQLSQANESAPDNS